MTKGLWLGVANETGGEILIGKNTVEGWLLCMDDPLDKKRYAQIQVDRMSIGVGLGGSTCVYAVICLNATTPSDLAGTDSGFDFSLDLALGAGEYIRSVPDYLKFYYEFSSGIKRLLFKAGSAGELLEKHEKLKSIGENIIANVGKIGDLKRSETVTIMVPVYSLGLRVSLKYQWAVTDVLSWGTKNLEK